MPSYPIEIHGCLQPPQFDYLIFLNQTNPEILFPIGGKPKQGLSATHFFLPFHSGAKSMIIFNFDLIKQ
jgi:hypothetical protein